jgi:hypothetical protein
LTEGEIEIILILKNDDFRVQPVAEIVEEYANNGNSSQGVALVFV